MEGAGSDTLYDIPADMREHPMILPVFFTSIGTALALFGSAIVLFPWIPPVNRWLKKRKDIPQLAAGRQHLVKHNFLHKGDEGFFVIVDLLTEERDIDGDFVEIRYHIGWGMNGAPMYLLTKGDIEERDDELDNVGEHIGDFSLYNPRLMQEKNDRWQSIQQSVSSFALFFLVLGAALQVTGFLLI